jgi:hypothetical protein
MDHYTVLHFGLTNHTDHLKRGEKWIYRYIFFASQPGFSGAFCDQEILVPDSSNSNKDCLESEFYSEEDEMCISCFCMGIPSDDFGTPTQCQASNLPRNVEKVEFYDGDSLGFSLTDENFSTEIPDLETNGQTRELYFDKISDLDPRVCTYRVVF